MSFIQQIFSKADVKHGLSLHSDEEINEIEKLIKEENGIFLIGCQIKKKYKIAKPEEIVRQLWINKLIKEYNYPINRIEIEKIVVFGARETGLADIVVLHEDLENPYIIFEIKRPSRSKGREQLKSYCNAEGAPIGIWTNGNEIIRLHREEPNIYVNIPRIPLVTEELRDILKERWTLAWLEEHNELKEGKTTLKKILLDLEELVLGNAGVEPFDEIFKLIYAKLYDEWKAIRNPSYQLEFFAGDRSPTRVFRAVSNLLEGAKRTWSGVFEPTETIGLRPEHLKICVSFLGKIKLFNSNLQIIDEAFEYLIPQVSKKKEGQFFTPRPVIDMIVKMLNPKPDEFIIDPACGSAGFLLHSVIWISDQMINGAQLSDIAINFAQNNIYGIDFAQKTVKISKAINLIIGDGKSQIFKDNSLLPSSWSEETKSVLKNRLIRYPDDISKDKHNQSNFLEFDFDVLMTNPPFAGTVTEKSTLRLYNLSEKKDGKLAAKRDRHILFIERSLQLVRNGGRIGIILPQGIFNNQTADYIRHFIINNTRILAVVGLHENTFKTHTSTKTSVLLIQKHTEEEQEKIEEILLKYQSDFEILMKEYSNIFSELSWKSNLDKDEIDKELMDFIESYFETSKELKLEESTEIVENDTDNNAFLKLTQTILEIEEIINEKQLLLQRIEPHDDRFSILKKDIRNLSKSLKKHENEIMKYTIAGQICLVLNKENIRDQFKKFWINLKLFKEIDHPIFFAINQKPLKNNKGEYIYKKDENNEFIVDEHEHLIIDHDLDEIADSFIDFVKKNNFYFWS